MTENKQNKPIGVYDSGVGGLTVFKELVDLLPSEKFIYFGDIKNLPYGEKSKEELIKIGKNIFDFFALKNVKAVVMACNTTSALLYDKVKNEYPFKIYPVIQTVAKDLANNSLNSLGVLATPATINSHAYKNQIMNYNPQITVFEQACPDWVKIVENKDFSFQNIEIIKNDLEKMLMNNPQKIVLGCTHYPYLIDILSEFAPKEMFINPAKKFAQLIMEDLKTNNLCIKNGTFQEEFYVSKNPQQFVEAAKMFYEIKTPPVLKNFTCQK